MKIKSILLLAIIGLSSSAFAFPRGGDFGGGGFDGNNPCNRPGGCERMDTFRSDDSQLDNHATNLRNNYSVQHDKSYNGNQVDNTTTITNKQNNKSYNVNNTNTYNNGYKNNSTTITNNQNNKSYTANSYSTYNNGERITKVTNNQTGQTEYVVNGKNTPNSRVQNVNVTTGSTTYVAEPAYVYPVGGVYMGVGIPMGYEATGGGNTTVNNYYGNGNYNPAVTTRNESQLPMPTESK